MSDPGKTDLRPASERAQELRRRILEAVEAGFVVIHEMCYLDIDGAHPCGCLLGAGAYSLGARRTTYCRDNIVPFLSEVASPAECCAVDAAFEDSRYHDHALLAAHPEFAALGTELRSLAAGRERGE